MSTPAHGRQPSQPPDPNQYAWPQYAPQPLVGSSVAQPAQRRRWLHIVGYPLVAVIAAGIGSAATQANPLSASPSVAHRVAAAPIATTTADEAPVADVTAPTLDPSNYEVTLKILSKECFGSAGCNVTARPVIAGDTATNGVAAELTIEIRGGNDGASVQTITLDESGQYSADEALISTASAGRKLTAKITAVEVL
jgi:hypothetical protein